MSGPLRGPDAHDQQLATTLHRIHELATSTAALERVLAFGGPDWIVNTAARRRHENLTDLAVAQQHARLLRIPENSITAARLCGQSGHRWIEPEPGQLSDPEGIHRWAQQMTPDIPRTDPGWGHRVPVEAGDLPQQTSRWLRQVQRLAAQATQMRQDTTLTAAGGDIRVLAHMVARAGQIDRHREAAEIRAHAAGVSLQWIAWARIRGHLGREWHPNQPLATPILDTRHRAAEQVTDDLRHVTDMAALTVARDHLYSADLGVDTQQLTHTMDALWLRAARTAQAAGLTAHERGRIWSASTHDCITRVHHLVRFPRHEIDTLWHQYAVPEIAAQAREAFDELGHDHRTTSLDAATELLPPAPHYFLARARHALDQIEAGTPADGGIGTAIAEVIPATDRPRLWDTDTTPHTHGDTDTTGPQPGQGPEP
ncbi:hypothetical protein [Nocardia jiangxiensis]|uniref:hypothetical protein n=1 Tax=Nocardia jiangxiensis TaxID=282685 RepID=UPI00030E5258|nr:hypothetical protein [Nocardia jiangxiensis]